MPVSIENFYFVSKVFVCRGWYFDFGTGKHKPDCRKRSWEPYDFTYDSVPQAMLTLFTVQTGEGWPT
jgi:hypothetical protein